MTGKIPQNVTHAIRNRRGLLWVIQRYDLNPNEEPHPSDLPENEAAVRYRSTPDDTDRGLASLYWEAAWFEGAISPVLKAMRENADSQLSKNRRAVVVLAGTADAAARVPTGEFLPAAVLPGLIDSTAPMDARYGNLRPRVRDRLAWDLASRMAEYNDRVLVVTGLKSRRIWNSCRKLSKTPSLVNLSFWSLGQNANRNRISRCVRVFRCRSGSAALRPC